MHFRNFRPLAIAPLLAAGCIAALGTPVTDESAVVLQSDSLAVRLTRRGAQLQSVAEHASGHEYLWQNPTGDWAGPAPVLFPVVGSLREKAVRWAGRLHAMPQHGFARERDFTMLECSPRHTVFKLAGTGDAKFPCPFELRLEYRLSGRRLEVIAEIANPGGDVLPAAIGFHPGFAIALPIEQNAPPPCTLEVRSSGPLVQLLKSPDTRLLDGQRKLWSEGRRILPLALDALGSDAVVLACSAPVSVELRSTADSHRVVLQTFSPFLGLWRKPSPTAAFVCLEPWWGTTDPDAPYDDLRAKPHQPLIAPGSTLRAAWSVEFL